MLSGFFREPQNTLAVFAFAVNVSFSVADTVALKSEKSTNTLDESEKIVVLLASLVEVLGEIAEERPSDHGNIDSVDDQPGYAL